MAHFLWHEADVAIVMFESSCATQESTSHLKISFHHHESQAVFHFSHEAIKFSLSILAMTEAICCVP